MAISFIQGPQINNWAKEQKDALKAKILPPRNLGQGDELLWTGFEDRFHTTFTDTAKEQQAYQKLLDLHMAGNNIDTYNTRFNHLLTWSGWPQGDKGTIEQYHCSLRQGITLKIYDKNPMPQSLDEWQEAARTEVLQQAQITADLGLNPFPRRDRLQGPQWPQGGGSYHPRDPSLATVPMDLSIGQLGGNLSDTDKKKLMDEGRCFYCKEKGHCANKCPKKPQQLCPVNWPTPHPSQNHATEITSEENTESQPSVCDLCMQLQAMTTEDRGELLNLLMHDDLDF